MTFYQYIASIKKDSLLINPKLQSSYYSIDFKNQQENEAFVYPSLWSLPVGKFRKINTLDNNLHNSKDSQAITIKFDKLTSEIPRCQERYIRIKSDKTILVSLASNDDNFPDTPNTMLGDMKQINFGMVGKTDFTYFYDSNTGKQVYPGMYLTIIDVVDDTQNLASQNIEVGIGIRRTNLLSHIDNKNMCAENVPIISKTDVIADGKIPNQYRDINEASKYIDRIKITCLESGEVFDAKVNSDGTWAANIHIVFNGNQSRFNIEGYNANNSQRVIARQRIVIVK